MKKLFFLVPLVIFMILSCTKTGFLDFNNINLGGSIPIASIGGTITASVDGNNTTFNCSDLGKLSGSYHFHCSGLSVNGSSQIDLDIDSPNPISTGTLTENTAAGNPVATIKYTWYEPSGWHPAIPFNSAGNPVTITITSIDASSIKGTFKGDLKFTPNSGSPTIKHISNGAFEIKI